MTDLTFTVIPSEPPVIEARIGDEAVEFTTEEATKRMEALHEAIFVTSMTCAHVTCTNIATTLHGYCGRCGA